MPVHKMIRSILRLGLLSALLFALSPVAPAHAQGGSVSIYQAHLFLWPMGEQVWIVEHFMVGNSGLEPYLAPPNASDPEPISGLRFPLPSGATHIAVGAADDPSITDDRYRITEQAIIFTEAIPAGAEQPTEVRFSYILPLQVSQPITRVFPLEVQSAVMLLVGEGWELAGSGIAGFGSMEVSGQPARSYTGDPLSAGAPMRFTINAAPLFPTAETPAPTPRTSQSTEWLVGVIVLAAAGGLAYRMVRPGAKSPLEPPQGIQENIAEIAELDARYKRGELEPSVYQESREALLALVRAQLEARADDRSPRA